MSDDVISIFVFVAEWKLMDGRSQAEYGELKQLEDFGRDI